MENSDNLAGHLLIAMPGMTDPNFSKTVIYLLEHTAEGSLGLVVNRSIGLDMGEVLSQLSLPTDNQKLASQSVLAGGPVEPERGFVLHDYLSSSDWESTMSIGNSISVTTSADILGAVAADNGPERIIMTLGYAGWSPGQLQAEIAANAWLSVPATVDLLFDTPLEQRWEAAARLLGVELSSISPEAGHA